MCQLRKLGGVKKLIINTGILSMFFVSRREFFKALFLRYQEVDRKIRAIQLTLYRNAVTHLIF